MRKIGFIALISFVFLLSLGFVSAARYPTDPCDSGWNYYIHGPVGKNPDLDKAAVFEGIRIEPFKNRRTYEGSNYYHAFKRENFEYFLVGEPENYNGNSIFFYFNTVSTNREADTFDSDGFCTLYNGGAVTIKYFDGSVNDLLKLGYLGYNSDNGSFDFELTNEINGKSFTFNILANGESYSSSGLNQQRKAQLNSVLGRSNWIQMSVKTEISGEYTAGRVFVKKLFLKFNLKEMIEENTNPYISKVKQGTANNLSQWADEEFTVDTSEELKLTVTWRNFDDSKNLSFRLDGESEAGNGAVRFKMNKKTKEITFSSKQLNKILGNKQDVDLQLWIDGDKEYDSITLKNKDIVCDNLLECLGQLGRSFISKLFS